jgi:hypothetical protein
MNNEIKDKFISVTREVLAEFGAKVEGVPHILDSHELFLKEVPLAYKKKFQSFTKEELEDVIVIICTDIAYSRLAVDIDINISINKLKVDTALKNNAPLN